MTSHKQQLHQSFFYFYISEFIILCPGLYVFMFYVFIHQSSSCYIIFVCNLGIHIDIGENEPSAEDRYIFNYTGLKQCFHYPPHRHTTPP